MASKNVTLNDKYDQLSGSVFLSSIQALVRLPMDQARRDRAAGLSTAGFISGYRGSPIGTYDSALWATSAALAKHRIRFHPGLNEELAATSVRGTQELSWFGKSQVEGVFALWYGKGLGVDRAHEALKLGNLEGAAAKGGVLVIAGDDHGGKSSVSSHQSEHVLIAGMMPILYPAGTADILEFGLFGIAMSRYSGLYVSLKAVTDSLDLTSSIQLPDILRRYVVPDFEKPLGGLNLRPAMAQLAQEDLTVNWRLPAAQAFTRANGLDRVVMDPPNPVLTIVSAGKAYLDTRQAMADLGLDEAVCLQLGIRLYKPGLVWPLEPTGLRRAAAGARELLVVEEKRPVIQDQITVELAGMPGAPRVLGKRDEQGSVLLPSVGELNPTVVRGALIRRLRALGIATDEIEAQHARGEEILAHAAATGGTSLTRPAFFCSGCPHNTSTKVPDGSQAMGATGCHAMPSYMPGSVTMRPMTMGAEGMPWLGVADLVEVPHMFQNMGDGTYSHSGLLAIRAAVAAGVNMTYKILYNDAVAMTGGQPIEGAPSPYSIVDQLLAEGVKPVAVVYDPAEFDPSDLRSDVRSYPRAELDRVQREFRDKKGVSAIVYVQTCAAEKRRRRKRGTFPDPDKRVYINPAVCEGCGDCSVQSNCISIQPLETEFGRKRQIDQSSCNKDFSCLKGFCPSFVTIEGGAIARRVRSQDDRIELALATLPRPVQVSMGPDSYNILVTGIGGTGVLTVGAIIGMAAHLEGRACTVMDMTGMAQKGGAVTSHIHIAERSDHIYNARLDAGMTDALIGCDLIVAANADVLKTLKPNRTRAVLNTDVASTGEFARNRDLDLNSASLQEAVCRAMGEVAPFTLRATKHAYELTGDAITTNMLMLGYAAQAGLLPVSIESIEQAIRLNGVSVESNLRVLGLGRLAATQPELLAATEDAEARIDSSLDGILASRTRLLTEFQDEAYARQYSDFVEDVRNRLDTREIEGSDEFVRQVATSLARLMSYKDEYEVARLHSDPTFWNQLREQFEGDFKVTFHLAPPLLSRTDPATGRPKKITFGPWMKIGFGILKKLKFLRGTPFDPFGYTKERRQERREIADYRDLITAILPEIEAHNLDVAIKIAGAGSELRGFGPVKDAARADYRVRQADLLKQFRADAVEPADADETSGKDKGVVHVS